MKRLIVMLLLTILSVMCIGAEEKYGFIDKTGKVVIEPSYDDAKSFSEGLAAVKLNGKWGFIDVNGKIVIDPKYDEVYNFYEEYAKVCIKNKWGFINKEGKITVEMIFDSVGSFSDGVASAGFVDKKKGRVKYGYINKQGEYILKPKYFYADGFESGFAIAGDIIYIGDKGDEGVYDKYNYYIIDKKGKKVEIGYKDYFKNFSSNAGYIQPPIISEGFIVTADEKGLIDLKNKKIITPILNENEVIDYKLYGVKEGFIALEIKPKTGNGKYCFYNIKNNQILSKYYESGGYFNDGLAIIKENGKYGCINKNGEIILKPIYDRFLGFSDEIAYVEKDKKLFYIDKSGKILFYSKDINQISWESKNGRIKIRGKN